MFVGHTPSTWRQIWRVAGGESGSPELLGSPRTSPEVPRTSPEVFGDFPGSSLTVELNSNPEVPRKFPKLPRKFPNLPRKFRDFPGGQPLSLGSLTPSPDPQKLSLKYGWDFPEEILEKFGKTQETLSERFLGLSRREYGWDPPNPIIEGI